MSLKDRIISTRNEDSMTAIAKRQKISKLVIDAMKKGGRLIRSTGGELFWLHRKGAKLYDLGTRLWDAKLNKVTGLNPVEVEYRHLKHEIELECIREGQEEEISRLSRYDQERKVLYVYLGQGRVARLDGGIITWISNGCGCLFVEDELFEPVRPIFTEEDKLSHILNLVKFNDSYLSQGEIELLWKSQLDCTFVPDFLMARPLILYLGDEGSGKTTLQRIPGYIIYGSKFDVTNRLRTEDAFDAAVCHTRYLAIDNLTKCSAWMEERLKTISTGTTIRLRKLYTTNEQVTYFPRCLVSISSIKYPYSDAADTLSRIIPFEIEKPPAHVSDMLIRERVLKSRNYIWGQILVGLNEVLRVRSGRQPTSCSSRLGDFFELVSNVAEIRGQKINITSLINRLELHKLNVSGKDDRVLRGLIKIIPTIKGQKMSAEEICQELAKVNVDVDAVSLGKRLPGLKPALKNMGYDLHIIPARANVKLYLFEESEVEMPIGG